MNNVLFISYFMPPSGKASLHWPLFMMKHLPSFAWQPCVLTVDEDTFSHKDESLLKEISPATHVVKTKAFEPFNIYRKFLGKKKEQTLIASETISLTNTSLRHKLAIWIRMNLFVPDARVGWNFSAVRGGRKLIKEHRVQAIVSIGPPHSSHLIGMKLSRQYNIPHIPVLIDPWVDIVYYKNFQRSALTLAVDNYFERGVLDHAAHALFVTQSTQEDYARKYSFLKNKSSVLYWGYNEEAFEQLPPKQRSEYEIILHAGNIFDYQNPQSFWRNVKNEIERGRKLKIKFVGTVSPGIKHSLYEIGLEPYTEYLGFLPYQKVVEEMCNASYLLVCTTEKRHLPGKLFEYLRTGNPIIAFGDDNSEIENILLSANAGVLLPYNYSGDDMFQKLSELKPDIETAKKFNRLSIAKELAEILEKCVK